MLHKSNYLEGSSNKLYINVSIASRQEIPFPRRQIKGKRGKILIKKKGKEIKTLSLSLCAKSKEAFPMQTTLLPDSTTTEPGLRANLKITILISVV